MQESRAIFLHNKFTTAKKNTTFKILNIAQRFNLLCVHYTVQALSVCVARQTLQEMSAS